MIREMKRILKNESGQGLTEYITILVLVSLVSVAGAISLGKSIKGKIKDAREHIESQIQIHKK